MDVHAMQQIKIIPEVQKPQEQLGKFYVRKERIGTVFVFMCRTMKTNEIMSCEKRSSSNLKAFLVKNIG